MPTPQPPAIQLQDLRLVLASYRLNRYAPGRVSVWGAYSRAPLLQVDCHHGRPRASWLDTVRQHSHASGVSVGPLQRGHMLGVVQRTRRCHGLAEVQRTWRTGLRALLAEPCHVLRGALA